jgi:hypothetical protein
MEFEGDTLGDKRILNVVLRIVLDRNGALQQGEVVASRGSSRGRFNTWDAVTPLVRRVVQQVWDEES